MKNHFLPPRYGVLTGAALLFQVLLSTSAEAAPRTFVASTGNDANACTRTAPCRTFGAAAAQADAGGEVVVLDSAGYGPSTFTKSITLFAPRGIYAGVSTTTGTAFTVQGAATDTVVLDGLILNGFDTASHGIDFLSGKSLTVANCHLQGFTGIGINCTTPGHLYASDSTIQGDFYAQNIGIYLLGGTSANALAELNRCRLSRNGNALYTDDNSRASARNCVWENNEISVNAGVTTATTTSDVVLYDCAVNQNTFGLTAYFGGTIRVAESEITDNDIGLDVEGGKILTQTNNLVEGNGTNGAFNGTLAMK